MPSGQLHLPKAPIVEAVFDVRVEGADPFDASRYEPIAKAEEDRYPDQGPQFEVEVVAGFAPPGTGTVRQQSRQIGLLLRSADGRQLVQVSERGLTLNRLAPYTSWEDLRPEVLRLWRLHQNCFPAGRCTRVAIRTINRIELDDVAGLGEVITVPPTMPAELGLRSESFLMRHEMLDEPSGLRVVVHQASTPPSPTGGRAILLDIDVFREAPFLDAADAVSAPFEAVHHLKNQVFERAIVPAWLKRYQ